MKRCTVCGLKMPDLNYYGECIECVDYAESVSGF